MKDIEALKTIIVPILIVLFFWFVIRSLFKLVSDKINNAEVYKEELLSVLQEIRDELKDLNKNNSIK